MNAFGKAAKTIRIFLCIRDVWGNAYILQNQPPKYDIWSSLSQLTHVGYIGVGLNVSEMPSNAFGLNPNKNVQVLEFQFHQNVTIQSGAFQNFNQLNYIRFLETNITSFKNG